MSYDNRDRTAQRAQALQMPPRVLPGPLPASLAQGWNVLQDTGHCAELSTAPTLPSLSLSTAPTLPTLSCGVL